MKTTSISLVDDHILLRAGLSALINSFDEYQVILEADNGRHFIEQLDRNNPPEIVLLDISMPLMNGYETAEWIRDNLPATKVIVLSMMEKDTAIIRMLRYGARGYILKDTKPAQFLHALNYVRDHGYYTNDLVTSRMWHYVNQPQRTGEAMPFVHLTEREICFLKLACTEKTYKEIADEMNVSPRTVDSYRDGLFEKLQVTSRVGLVIFAVKEGIIAL